MADAHAPPDAAPDTLGVTANAIESAQFVHIRTAPTGDAIAAACVLVSGLEQRSIPYHVRIVRGYEEIETDPNLGRDTPDDDDDLTVSIGRPQSDTQHVLPPAGSDRSASVASATLLRELGIEPDPVRALAGVVAAGDLPGENGSGPLVDAALQQGRVIQRPGIGRATHDLADGIAHSTLFHADFSGDPTAVSAILASLDLPAEVDDAGWTRLASRVAIEATSGAHADVTSPALDRVLRPHETPNGPLATIEGLGDVLETVSSAQPGVALAYALSPEHEALRTTALDCWRSESQAAHTAIRSAHTSRYDGLVVVRAMVDRPSVLSTVARIIAETRSPEPAVLAIGTEPIEDEIHAVLRISDEQSAITVLRTAASEFGGRTAGTTNSAQTTVPVTDVGVGADKIESRLLAAVREGLK